MAGDAERRLLHAGAGCQVPAAAGSRAQLLARVAQSCGPRRQPRRGQVHGALRVTYHHYLEWYLALTGAAGAGPHDPDGRDGEHVHDAAMINISYNDQVNIFYEDDTKLAADLVTCINQELRGLAEAGCTHVQIDEPVMMR